MDVDTRKRGKVKRFWCFWKQEGDNLKFIMQKTERDSFKAVVLEAKEIKEIKVEEDRKKSLYQMHVCFFFPAVVHKFRLLWKRTKRAKNRLLSPSSHLPKQS